MTPADILAAFRELTDAFGLQATHPSPQHEQRLRAAVPSYIEAIRTLGGTEVAERVERQFAAAFTAEDRRASFVARVLSPGVTPTREDLVWARELSAASVQARQDLTRCLGDATLLQAFKLPDLTV